jgi:hypothetical protein
MVAYTGDAAGRLVIPRHGQAVLQITNDGGLTSGWYVTGNGFIVNGTNQGTVAPGQVVTVGVGSAGDVGATGSIKVIGARNPVVPFVVGD